jgi:hypothetical protein
VTFPKTYDDSKYKGRAQKEACRAILPDGTQCQEKRIKGQDLCGRCLERGAAEEQARREAAQAEKK